MRARGEDDPGLTLGESDAAPDVGGAVTTPLLGVGQVFAGRYRIDRFLAEGGMGAVFVAEQIATEQRVALKVLWPHVLKTRDATTRFSLEARVSARIASEHIVRVLDAGVDETTRMPFLTMELLDGEDLENVASRGPVRADLVVGYLAQTAAALDKAHAYTDVEGKLRPIIHRDLKPENLFLTRRENGEPFVKVLDFGIAKIVSETNAASQDMKGTPYFMAPEQALGGKIGPETDVWALGLIAYRLLTSSHYWRTASLENVPLLGVVTEVLMSPIEAPSSRIAESGAPVELPAAFDGWFLRCVDREPSNRFPSAGEAIAALADALGVESDASHQRRAPVTISVGLGAPAAATSPTALAPDLADLRASLSANTAPATTAQVVDEPSSRTGVGAPSTPLSASAVGSIRGVPRSRRWALPIAGIVVAALATAWMFREGGGSGSSAAVPTTPGPAAPTSPSGVQTPSVAPPISITPAPSGTSDGAAAPSSGASLPGVGRAPHAAKPSTPTGMSAAPASAAPVVASTPPPAASPGSTPYDDR